MRTNLVLCAVVAAIFVPGAGASGFTWSETPVAVSAGDQYNPSISGPYVTYTDLAAGDADVDYADLRDASIHTVAAGSGDQQLSDVFGHYVVYTSTPIGGEPDVFLYDISSGTTSRLTNTPWAENVPKGTSDLVAWEGYATGSSDICIYRISTSSTSCLTAPGDQLTPAVSGSYVSYIDQGANYSLVVYNADTGATRTIFAGPAQSPDVDGNHVAFANVAGSSSDIAVYDLASGSMKTLMLAGDQLNPHVSGDWVSFEDLVTGISHIGLWNYVTGELEHVNVGPSSQTLSDIDGNHVVYTDDRAGRLDIYSLQFASDTTPPTLSVPSGVTVDATSPAGAVVTYGATAKDDTDPNPSVSCAPPSGSTFAIGTTTVTCTARDASGNAASASFPVVVRGAGDQLNALIAEVKSLGLPPLTQATLVGELLLAKTALANGYKGVACAAMATFVSEVNALSGRTIKATDAADLVARATRIEAVVAC